MASVDIIRTRQFGQGVGTNDEGELLVLNEYGRSITVVCNKKIFIADNVEEVMIDDDFNCTTMKCSFPAIL